MTPSNTLPHAVAPGPAPLILVSHRLCPYVQRVAIVLTEKKVAFERRDVDLAHKPDWFHAVSPLGKTPVLLVDGQAIFESAVICEYLDEIHGPRLHPADPLERARHRSWMEFGSTVLHLIAGFYNAPDNTSLMARRDELGARFLQLEAALGEGPFFAGSSFSLVDAVFAPVFRYVDVLDEISDFGLFATAPATRAWRAHLAARASVRSAVAPDYADQLRQFLRRRGSALSGMMIRGDGQQACLVE